MFLVNRPCATRHCPANTVIAGLCPDAGHAKTVIAGLDPAIHRKMGGLL
jgi:hypothetical protein